MKNFAKHSSGFISLSFVFILMAFLSLYLTATFAIALSQQRDYIRSQCVREAAALQGAILKDVRQLFGLNTASTSLRAAIKVVQVELALALATGQLEFVEILRQKLNLLYQKQNELDQIQKILIDTAKIQLANRHTLLIAKLNRGQQELSYPWRFMMTMSSYFSARFKPMVAIRPDTQGGVAPNYEWQEQAEKKQLLAYSWNMYFETKDSYQRFFNWFNVLSIQCSVGPNLKENQRWHLTINADK